MNNVAQFGWKDATPTYSQSYLEPAILRILRYRECKSILDLGCGNGALVKRLSDRGFQPVGCEPDVEGAAIARRSLGGIPIYNIGVGDRTAEIKEKPFDAVISTEVIEHLYDPKELFGFASGVLKHDGTLIVSTPYHGYFKNLVLSATNMWDFHHHPQRTGGHIKFWSRKTLEDMFCQNGYEVVSFLGAARLPWLWKSMIVVGKRRLRG